MIFNNNRTEFYLISWTKKNCHLADPNFVQFTYEHLNIDKAQPYEI